MVTERLEFVDIQKERWAGAWLDLRSAQSREANRRDNQPAEQIRPVFSEPALGKIHNERAAFVHETAEADWLGWSDKHAMQARVGEESSEFVLDRSDNLVAVSIRVSERRISKYPSFTSLRELMAKGQRNLNVDTL